jgi:hypothetical protein
MRIGALADTDENTVQRLKAGLQRFMAEQGIASWRRRCAKLAIANNGGKAPLVVRTSGRRIRPVRRAVPCPG